MSLTNKPTINEITNSVSNLDSNFLPKETTIHVELDGSGDFTSFESALAYLEGKYSNGIIIIQLGDGTFTVSDDIHLSGTDFNISQIHINGNGINNTILSYNGDVNNETFGMYIERQNVRISNLTYTKVNGTTSTSGRGISCGLGSFVEFRNFKIVGCDFSIAAASGGNANVGENIYIEKCKTGIIALTGTVTGEWGTNYTFKNITNSAIGVGMGGIVTIAQGTTLSQTSVNKLYSQNTGIISNTGYISASL